MALITTTVGRTVGNLDDARMWRPLGIGIVGSAILMGCCCGGWRSAGSMRPG